MRDRRRSDLVYARGSRVLADRGGSLGKAIKALVVLALAGCAGESEPYVVGAAGPWKEGYGLQNLQGIRLAVDEINKAGGINGRPLRVIERDDAGTGSQAAAIAHEFVSNPAVSAVIGHVNSSGMLSAASVYDGNLAAIATSATSPDLTGISSWVFRIISSDSLNGIALANFASAIGKKGSVPTAAILYENHAYGRGLADSFRRSFRGQIVSVDPINADLPSAEPYITYLKAKQPSIVFVAGRVPSGLKILREAKRQGFKATFIGGDGWQGVIADTATSEGAYIGMSFTRQDPNPSARAFVAAFRKKFMHDPEAHAALAYDATNLVAHALRESGRDRTAVRDYLRSLTSATAVPGVTGPAYFEETGDPVGIRFRVGRVESGLLKVANAK